MSKFLLQTADILEKTAAYLERIDSEKIAAKQEAQQKQAHALAEKISDATGMRVEDELLSKLAELSPEVQDVISRIAGGDPVESMGGPSETTKVASAGGIGPAEASFLSFLTS
jgi:hypothetical protein